MSYTNPTRIRIKSLYKDNNLDTLKKKMKNQFQRTKDLKGEKSWCIGGRRLSCHS